MGRGKRLTSEENGSIKCLREEMYSNREIARRIHRSAKVVNNFVQDIENYRKNYRGGIQTATTARKRTILREASNSTMTPRKIKEALESAASLRTVQRLIKKCAHLSRCRLKKKTVLTQRH
jgi:IS30 family transposase